MTLTPHMIVIECKFSSDQYAQFYSEGKPGNVNYIQEEAIFALRT